MQQTSLTHAHAHAHTNTVMLSALMVEALGHLRSGALSASAPQPEHENITKEKSEIKHGALPPGFDLMESLL